MNSIFTKLIRFFSRSKTMSAVRLTLPSLSAAVLIGLGVSPAKAVTIIDFEDFGVTVGTQFDPDDGVGITTQGVWTYTPGPNNDSGFNDLHIAWDSPPTAPSNGSTIGGTHDDVILSRTDGQPFSLISFDFAGFTPGGEVPFTVIANTGSIANFTPDGIVDGVGGAIDFENFVLPAGFTNITSVIWNHTGSGTIAGIFALDNIVVDAVPEPTTVALAALGLLSIGCRRRK